MTRCAYQGLEARALALQDPRVPGEILRAGIAVQPRADEILELLVRHVFAHAHQPTDREHHVDLCIEALAHLAGEMLGVAGELCLDAQLLPDEHLPEREGQDRKRESERNGNAEPTAIPVG